MVGVTERGKEQDRQFGESADDSHKAKGIFKKAPRFPLEWLDLPTERAVTLTDQQLLDQKAVVVRPSMRHARKAVTRSLPPIGKPSSPVFWGVVLVAAGVAALYGLWQWALLTPSSAVGPTERVAITGIIEHVGMTPAGTHTLTVAAPDGRSWTGQADFDRTSVFQQQGILSAAHLQSGQEVRLFQENGFAKSIQILRQPASAVLR